MQYNVPQTPAAEVKEPVATYYTGGMGNAVAEPYESVLMDIENDEMFEKLQRAEANRLAGARTYTISEVSERLRERINGKK
jgi:DNA-binding protein Fis